MICRSCGNEIRDDARFCPHCGAVNSPDLGGGLPEGAAPYSAPAYTGPEAPVGGGKRKGLLIGGAVAVVAVLVLIVAAAAGLFANPKGQVEKAMSKSVAAYVQAEKALGLPELYQLSENRSVSQRFSLEVNRINGDLMGVDTSALGGLGLRMNTDLAGKERKLSFELGAFWGTEDIVSFQMLADDDTLYMFSPQFTGDTAYGVNTETLGADMAELSGDDSIEGVSFNIFDLMDIAAPEGRTKEMERAMKEANKALWDAADVNKAGAKTLDLNGTSTKTTAYQVTVPQKALEDYADAIVDALSAINYLSLYEEMFQAMGMPQEEIDSFLFQMEEADPYGQLAEVLLDAAEELGDVELTVCVSGGYVSAVLYEGVFYGEDLSLALYLGGGERYVDDLSLTITDNDFTTEIKSTGDHGLSGGILTDKTTVSLRSNGSLLGRLTSDFRYDPKASGNNLSWSMSIPSAGSLDMEGRLESGADSVRLSLEDISIKALGLEVCSLGMDYYMGPFQSLDLPDAMPKLIGEMNQLELMALGVSLQSNAQQWLADTQQMFAQRLPAELYSAIF